MHRLLLFIAIICISSFKLNAQERINNYKYIVVPDGYIFLKENNEYRLNELTKFLFNSNGYLAYLESDTYPKDLQDNPCLALYADVEKLKGFLKTKLKITLKNCKKELIHVSKEGVSKEKNYAKSYNLALRDAFKTYEQIGYKYQPNSEEAAGLVSTTVVDKTSQEEISRLQNEIKELKEASQTNVVATPVIKERVNVPELKTPVETAKAVLYAQPIENGFQIIDSEPKKVMEILYTGLKDVFVVKGRDAIVYKKGELWILSESSGASFKNEPIAIKF